MLPSSIYRKNAPFVMFSSVASLQGNLGQTNYAHANAAAEQLNPGTGDAALMLEVGPRGTPPACAMAARISLAS